MVSGVGQYQELRKGCESNYRKGLESESFLRLFTLIQRNRRSQVGNISYSWFESIPRKGVKLSGED